MKSNSDVMSISLKDRPNPWSKYTLEYRKLPYAPTILIIEDL